MHVQIPPPLTGKGYEIEKEAISYGTIKNRFDNTETGTG